MKCTQCNSEDIVTGLRIIDRGENNYRRDLEIEYTINPHKIINKGKISAKPQANVCLDCGFIMLSVLPQVADSFRAIRELKVDTGPYTDFEKHPKFKDYLNEDYANKSLNDEDKMRGFAKWLSQHPDSTQ